jgi:hypothetical protein
MDVWGRDMATAITTVMCGQLYLIRMHRDSVPRVSRQHREVARSKTPARRPASGLWKEGDPDLVHVCRVRLDHDPQRQSAATGGS